MVQYELVALLILIEIETYDRSLLKKHTNIKI
ncbi:MAG: hypothetical protein KatS3mg085_035 [Candidatus Dojkabacteria bacterium]|nr:MAG: hypothetical protein KatS3mg085_035 [Candidatus Dojkabacteria bacterium]